MEMVYISISLPAPEGEEEGLLIGNYEFVGDTWAEAFTSASQWLLKNRQPQYVYHVWA